MAPERQTIEQSAEGGFDFHAIVAILRRRLPIIVVCAVLVPAAAVAYTLTREEQYTASADLLFRDPALDQKLFGSSVLQSSADPEREAATNVRLVSLGVVAKRTERALGGRGLGGSVSASSDGNSNVVTINATSTDPKQAARLANAFGREFIAFRRDADRAKIRDAQRLIENELGTLRAQQATQAKVASLERRVEELDVLASLQTGNAELVQTAEAPLTPSSPNKRRNAIMGVLIGLLLGIALAFLLDRLDRRLRDPQEVEDILDRPVLAAVPKSRSLSRESLERQTLPVVDAEAFRMLRANLRYFNVDRDIHSVLITSSAPGDGKSIVSWNLAAAAASAGSGFVPATAGTKTLLIEADLRHPGLPRRPPDARQKGLSRVLAGDLPLAEAIYEISLEVPTNNGAGGSGPVLDVLFAGTLPPNPSDLIESARMKELIREAERSYDLVVIDTPPTSVVPDAIPLVKEVSGVIVVVRLGLSSRDSVAHLRNQLENLRAPVLGAVVNGMEPRRDQYGYGYGYGYAPSQDDGERRGAGRKLAQLRGR